LNEDKSPDSEVNKKIGKSSSHFVTPSILLFIDNLLVSVGGWLYWLVISKLTSASEIGLAVSVYSLVMLVTTLTQLGLEYPLLKKSILPGSKILGTALTIELVITVTSIPFLFIVTNNIYDESIKHFTWISIALLIVLSIEFITRFGLLGISNARTVLIIDLVGLAIKLPTGFILVSLSVGAMGILLAYLLEGLFITLTSLFVLKNTFRIQIGNSKYFKETIKDALINTPAKWSKMIIVTLSIVLLAFMNINASDVGVFYVALMITIVVGSMASSMAYMVIPSSSTLKKDLSSSSLRISLSLTAPIVVALLVVPRSILSLIGPEYEAAETVLLILAIAIIPSSITVNIISKLNNLSKSNMLILTGIIQIVIFVISFFFLVPTYQIIGAGISIMLAYLGSSLFLIILTDHGSFRYIAASCLSVFVGFIAGYIIETMVGHEQQFLMLICSVAVSIVIIFASKNMTIKEIKLLIKGMLLK
jgi:O-antigen/teichoic acid export membrane protein